MTLLQLLSTLTILAAPLCAALEPGYGQMHNRRSLGTPELLDLRGIGISSASNHSLVCLDARARSLRRRCHHVGYPSGLTTAPHASTASSRRSTVAMGENATRTMDSVGVPLGSVEKTVRLRYAVRCLTATNGTLGLKANFANVKMAGVESTVTSARTIELVRHFKRDSHQVRRAPTTWSAIEVDLPSSKTSRCAM